MRKGKSRTRRARTDILRSDARNRKQRERQVAHKNYDKAAYDGTTGEET